MDLSSLPSAGHSPCFFLQSIALLALPCIQTGSTAGDGIRSYGVEGLTGGLNRRGDLGDFTRIKIAQGR